MGFLQNNFISRFFLVVFNWLGDFFGDYAIAIIILTVIIRLAMLPADIKQKKSSRDMAKIQPQLNELKKRYANDPSRMQKEQQELYKRNNVRPMAGCLPLLITLPIFFAFFGSLRMLATQQTVDMIMQGLVNGVENIHIPSFLWVNNLWQPDTGIAPILPTGKYLMRFLVQNGEYITPQTLAIMQSKGLLEFSNTGINITAAYESLVNGIIAANGKAGHNNGWFILPLLSGAGLFYQQWMQQKSNPAMAEQQGGAMMMWFMPIFSVYICWISNAAFALYWVVSNLYALAQMFIVNKVLDNKQAKMTQNVINR
ncbi:MAG: YidC/Oxa1 family membrane protein insertase [Eubacteriales bacterium]